MASGERMVRAGVSLTLAVGASFVGWRAYGGIHETRALIAPGSLASAEEAHRQFACLEDALRALVPEGKRVHLELEGLESLTALAAAFPDRDVVASADQADTVFSLAAPPGSSFCDAGAFRAGPPQART